MDRLVVIAEKEVVYSKFPIPLINRLEKHYLVTSASLSPAQKVVVDQLSDWVNRFSDVNIPQHQQLRYAVNLATTKISTLSSLRIFWI